MKMSLGFKGKSYFRRRELAENAYIKEDQRVKVFINAVVLLFLFSQMFLMANVAWGEGLVVTSPAPGVSWYTTQTYTIQWNTTISDPTVEIYLYKKGQRKYSIAKDVPNNGQYVWTIPANTLINEFDEGQIYYVSMCSDSWCSVNENIFGIYFPSGTTPPDDPVTLNPPGNFNASLTSDTTASLSWSSVTGAVSYDIYSCTGAYISNTSSTGFTATGLSSGTTYSYKVRAKNSSGDTSDFTSCRSVTTPSAPIVTYRISGKTKEYDSTPIGHATVTLVGLSSVTSASDGSYRIDVPSGWSGTIRASKSGYSFQDENVFTVKSDRPGMHVYGGISSKTGLSASSSIKKTNWNTRYTDQYGKKCNQLECNQWDPVNTATGAQTLEYKLLTVNGLIPITFNLAYNSLVLDEGPAGKGWGFNYGFGARLEELADGDMMIHWASNRSNRFASDGNGQFLSSEPGYMNDKIIKNSDGSFTMKLQDKVVYEFDASGQLAKLLNAQGQALTFTHDAQGRLSRITEPVSGGYLDYAYNAEGLLESVTDPINRQVRLGYDANHHLISITDADGFTTTYTYNDKGQTLTAVNADGEQIFSNTYDAEGRIVSQENGVASEQANKLVYDEESQPGKIIATATDKLGHSRVFIYNDKYQMLEKKDELGNTSAVYTYDDKGYRTSATDANGHVSQFAYDSAGNMVTMTNAAGQTSQMAYDAEQNLISTTDAMGKQSVFTYDADNHLTSVTDPKGNTTNFTYNANGQVLTVTGPGGSVTTYEYENGRAVRVINPEGNARTMAYDGAGRLTTVTDAQGNAYTLSYGGSCATCSGSSRVASVTDPLGNTVHMTYNARGNLLSATDPKGNVTKYEYDGDGNRIRMMNALNQETRFAYDSENRLVQVTDAKGNITRLDYDAKGRMVKVTDALGNTHEMNYDKTRNLISRTDASGNTVLSMVYDALDNPVSVSDALGNTAQFEYDALHRLTKTFDPLNRATQFNYDELDRMVSAVDALGGKSEQSFDSQGNLTGIKDPNNNLTSFSFDKNGRLISESNATGNTVQYTYNAVDLLASVQNGRGQNRSFEYDAAGRLVKMSDPDGDITFAYDANGNVLTVTDSTGTITREYDALNRVVTYTNAQGHTIGYEYDSIGNLTALTYPDGKKVVYIYDALNRLISVTDWNARATNYEYDADSRLVHTVRPNGTVLTRTYNAAGQMIQQKDVKAGGEVIVQYDFTYDAAGNITGEKMTPAPEPGEFMPVNMTYGPANQMDKKDEQAVVHDADGNMIHGPLNGTMADFIFDSRNRLIQAGTTGYVYDAENQRIAVTEKGKQTGFVVNPNAYLSQVLVRTDADGGKTFYVYGLGLIGQETDGAYRGYHFDLRGSTVALTDEAGKVVDRFEYSPFAMLMNHDGDADTAFLYNGRDGVQSDDNGLYYMRARFYAPEIRRFVNQDVLLGNISDGGSLNRYAYVNSQPVQFIDPFGLLATHSYSEILPGSGYVVTIDSNIVINQYPKEEKKIDLFRDVSWEPYTPPKVYSDDVVGDWEYCGDMPLPWLCKTGVFLKYFSEYVPLQGLQAERPIRTSRPTKNSLTAKRYSNLGNNNRRSNTSNNNYLKYSDRRYLKSLPTSPSNLYKTTETLLPTNRWYESNETTSYDSFGRGYSQYNPLYEFPLSIQGIHCK